MPITIKNKIFKNIFYLFFFATFSCNDFGCIEASDYGEYDGKTFEVYANYAEHLCKRVEQYKTNYTSALHPFAFKKCFSTDCSSLNDIAQKSQCANNCENKCILMPEKFKEYTTDSSNPALELPDEYLSWNNPPYTTVGGSDELILEEKSAILINATGNISLSGGDKGTALILQKNSSSNNVNSRNAEISMYRTSPPINYLKLYPNQNYKINFSGKIELNPGGSSLIQLSNDTSNRNFQTETDNNLALNTLNYLDQNYIDGSKRIFAYYLKFPSTASNFPDNFPIYPEPDTWQCGNASNNVDIHSLKCSRDEVDSDDDYFTYQNTKNPSYLIESDKRDSYNKLFSKDFPIDNTKKETAIFSGTGFIRYTDDNLFGTDITFTDLPITLKKTLNLDTVNNTAQIINFPNDTTDYEIKVELTGDNCTDTKFVIFRENTPSTSPQTYKRIFLTPTQANENSSTIYQDFDPESSSNSVADWDHIVDNQASKRTFFIEKSWINSIYIKTHLASSTCPDVKISFFKYHNITASKSGYVSFGQIGNAANKNNFSTQISFPNPSCSLRFRIINKDGSYEEDERATDQIKPSYLESYGSPAQYYVRKGQVISFSPESWNGSWTASLTSSSSSTPIAITKKCGTEAYMKTVHYPAVFCTNYNISDKVDINSDANSQNNCVNPYLDPNTSKFIGCKEDYFVCNNLKNGTNPNNQFCPFECLPSVESFNNNCRPTYNAITETTTNPTNCDTTHVKLNENCIANDANVSGSKVRINSYVNSPEYSAMITAAGITSADAASTYFTLDNCNRCLTQLIDDAKKSIKPSTSPDISLLQCYDLEDYISSLKKIKDALQLSDPQRKNTINQLKINQKLKNLDSFNGSYGNLYPMSHVKNTLDSESYPIVSTKNSFYSPDGGYLNFFILGKRSADSNISFDTPYDFSDNTKVKIFLESKGEKSNGENLHINLCFANSSSECLSYSTPDNRYGSFDSQSILKVIDYDKTTSIISGQSNYAFNQNGFMYRVSPLKPESDPQYYFECGSRLDPDSAFTPFPLSNTLCFSTNFNASDKSNDKKYRLMLKIIDPEPANCNFSSPSSACSSAPSCTTGCCNGWRIQNPSYSGSNANYCASLTTTNCTEKYFCAQDPYANNSGKYEVLVRTKRSSKTSVSKFINGIISPILQEIEGSDSIRDERFVQNQTINNRLGSIHSTFYNNGSGSTTFLNEDASISQLGEANYGLDTSIKNPASAKTVTFSNVNDSFNVNINTTSSDHIGCSSGNCIISYIKFVSYGCQITADKASLDSTKIHARDGESLLNAIKQSCLNNKNCSMRFILDKTNPAQFSLRADGLRFYSQISNQAVGCTSSNPEKLIIKYYYSQSTRANPKVNQVKRIYNEIINTPVFKTVLTLSVTLMFSFYGMGFLMGVSELKQSEIFDRLIKVGLIYLFTHPQFGWAWFDKFFVTFFKGGTDFLTFLMASLFDDETSSVANSLYTGNYADKSPLFWSVDKVVSLLLINDVIHKKIGALIFYNFYGILYVIIIYHSVIAYVYTISNAVLLYLTAQFFTAILFILGPIFFVFILFKQTKNFFDNWINSLIGFSLQQIFLIFTLTLFNVLLYIIIKMTFGYKVCWDKVWKITAGASTISIFSFWTPNDSPPYVSEISMPTTKGEVKDTIPTLPKLLSLWTVTTIMKSFVSTITDLAASLSGGMSASELGSGVAGAMNKMVSQVNNTMNKAYVKSGAQKLTQMADKKLFNSGALAKQERKEKRMKMAADQSLKAKMESDGNKAVKDFKIKNADEYSKMNDEQKRAVLTKVKEDAMTKTAKDAGKSPKEIRNLMNDKGLKLTSDTIIGGLGEVAKQTILGGGTVNSSLAQRGKEVDIGMTNKEIQKAANNMDPDKRKDFLDGMKSGDNKINKTETMGEKIGKGDIKEAAKQTQMGKAYTNMQERKAAIKELEGEGAIKKQSFDTSNAPKSVSEAVRNPVATMKKGAEMVRGAIERRSDSDEKKIQERMVKNRNNKEDQGPKKEFSSDNIKAFEAKAQENDKKNK